MVSKDKVQRKAVKLSRPISLRLHGLREVGMFYARAHATELITHPLSLPVAIHA